jgi:translation elongation factor EF-Tu-like GTPase
MIPKPDFTAELYYYTKEQGGRSTPAFIGYRPQVKFPFSEMQTSGYQKFLDRDKVYPGETVTAEITIISIDHFKHQIYPGLEFEFREGSKVIGRGTVQQIFNEQLKAI